MNDYSSSKNEIFFDYKEERICIKNLIKREKNNFSTNGYRYGFFMNPMGIGENTNTRQAESEEVLVEIVNFTSQMLSNVKYFEFNVKEATLKIIAIEKGIYGWSFLIDNWQEYLKILSYIHNPDKELIYAMGIQKGTLVLEEKYFFCRHCFKMSFKKYNSHYVYLEDKLENIFKVSYTSDLAKFIDREIYISSDDRGDVVYLNNINFVDLFTKIKEFLPENMSKAKERELERERVELAKREQEKRAEAVRKEQEKQKQRIQEIIERKNKIDRNNVFSSDKYLDYLEDIDLENELKEITEEITYWQNAKELNAVESDWIECRITFLNEKILLVNQKYEQESRQWLLNEYGSIEDMKTDLLKMIKGMQFNDALNLYFHYTKLNEEFMGYYEECIFEVGAEPYLLYADFFKFGSIYISNYLNEINKMKSKKKVIPQKQINDALMYMYCVDSVEEALELQAQKDYLDNRSSGSKGEAEVEYALKWLVGNYIKIEPVECGKYGEKAIVLNNKDFIDEPQEFDHIVISKHGIFNIETKNYAGKLIVDKNGNWIRIKQDGNKVGERNPIQQVRRHEIMLRSIVGENVPIINILVMANPKMIIEGVENCSIPLLKSDRLEEFISNYQSEKVISDAEMKNIQSKIEKHRAMK